MRQELFTAGKGDGAYLDAKRIRVSKTGRLDEALLGTGFPYREGQSLDFYQRTSRHFTEASGGIRRLGSAALDLAYVAAGRLDGCWLSGLSAWDIAAGALHRARGRRARQRLRRRRRLDGRGELIAATPRVHHPMLADMKPLSAARRKMPDAEAASRPGGRSPGRTPRGPGAYQSQSGEVHARQAVGARVAVVEELGDVAVAVIVQGVGVAEADAEHLARDAHRTAIEQVVVAAVADQRQGPAVAVAVQPRAVGIEVVVVDDQHTLARDEDIAYVGAERALDRGVVQPGDAPGCRPARRRARRVERRNRRRRAGPRARSRERRRPPGRGRRHPPCRHPIRPAGPRTRRSRRAPAARPPAPRLGPRGGARRAPRCGAHRR